jgi:DNA-binding transcriptional regulator YiaG
MYAAVEQHYEETQISRPQAFRDFLDQAQRADVKEDEVFQRTLCRAQELLELSDQEMADALLVSRPTVNRWIRGKNLPHGALRKPILVWIVTQISKRLRRVEASAKSGA